MPGHQARMSGADFAPTMCDAAACILFECVLARTRVLVAGDVAVGAGLGAAHQHAVVQPDDHLARPKLGVDRSARMSWPRRWSLRAISMQNLVSTVTVLSRIHCQRGASRACWGSRWKST